MADRMASDLHYGHAGEVSLCLSDEDVDTWHAERSTAQSRLIPVGSSHLCWRAGEGPHALETRPTRNRTRVLEDIERLAACYPDLGSSTTTLFRTYFDDFGTSPEAPSSQVKGELLALVQVSPEVIPTNSRKPKYVPALACAHGSDKSQVKLVEIRDQRLGWDHGLSSDRSTWLQSKDFNSSLSVTWTVGGGRVLQLRSNGSPGKESPLLVVRAVTEVSIYSASYSTPGLLYADLPVASTNTTPTFMINHVFSLDLGAAGLSNCVDTRFSHPSGDRLAAVDSYGNWAIWETGGLTPTTRKTLSIRHRGRLTIEGDKRRKKKSMRTSDGMLTEDWCRLAWVCASQAIAVCNRSSFQIFDLSTTSKPDNAVLLPLGEAVVDMKAAPPELGLLYLLTSTSIRPYNIRKNAQEEEQTFQVRTGRACRHFRDSTDDSLALTFEQGDSDILLFSRYTSLITLHRKLEVEEKWIGVLPDALPLNLQLTSNGEKSEVLIADFLLSETPLKTSRQVLNSPGQVYSRREIEFFQAVFLTDSLECHRILLSREPATIGQPVPPLHPDWSEVTDGNLSTGKSWSKLTSGENKSSNGILTTRNHDDSDESLQDTDTDTDVSSDEHSEELWTVPNEALYAQVLEQQSQDMIPLVPAIEAAIIKSKAADKTFTLQSLVEQAVEVDDVDHASRILRSLTLQEENSSLPEGVSASLVAPHLLASSSQSSENLNLSRLYRTLLTTWLEPMPTEVPGRARLAREHRLRNIAGEVLLASTIIGPEEEQETAVPVQESDDGIKAIDTSFIENVAGRIARYTSIAAPPDEISQSVREIMEHQAAFGDPADYDYEEVLARQAGVSNVRGANLTREQQRKMMAKSQRRAEREQRRQQRLRAGSQPLGNLRGWGSSQAQGSSEAGDSQTQPTGDDEAQATQAVASQIEPGRYGGRQVFNRRPVGKRPARKAGF